MPPTVAPNHPIDPNHQPFPQNRDGWGREIPPAQGNSWFDPYWNRQLFLNNGQWWWQGPDGMYLYSGGNYYLYANGDNGVVVTPDQTPPVNVPPVDPTAPAAPVATPTTYSLDGTRSVQIVDDNRDAYLYDMTVADPNSVAAQGRFIGTEVAGVKFDYLASAGGSAVQAIQQIGLSYDDPSASSVVDVNGERRVDVSGSAQAATLIDLTTTTANSQPLATGVTATAMIYRQTEDVSGNAIQRLMSIELTVTNASGSSMVTFDRDGVPSDVPAQAPQAAPAPQAQMQTMQQKLQGSETFRALQSGFGW
jgi:hypothetical protein